MKVVIRDEGRGMPMYGTYGILPPEAHKIVMNYKAYNIEVYRDYDIFYIDISDEDDLILTSMHKKLQEEGDK